MSQGPVHKFPSVSSIHSLVSLGYLPPGHGYIPKKARPDKPYGPSFVTIMNRTWRGPGRKYLMRYALACLVGAVIFYVSASLYFGHRNVSRMIVRHSEPLGAILLIIAIILTAGIFYFVWKARYESNKWRSNVKFRGEGLFMAAAYNHAYCPEDDQKLVTGTYGPRAVKEIPRPKGMKGRSRAGSRSSMKGGPPPANTRLAELRGAPGRGGPPIMSTVAEGAEDIVEMGEEDGEVTGLVERQAGGAYRGRSMGSREDLDEADRGQPPPYRNDLSYPEPLPATGGPLPQKSAFKQPRYVGPDPRVAAGSPAAYGTPAAREPAGSPAVYGTPAPREPAGSPAVYGTPAPRGPAGSHGVYGSPAPRDPAGARYGSPDPREAAADPRYDTPPPPELPGRRYETPPPRDAPGARYTTPTPRDAPGRRYETPPPRGAPSKRAETPTGREPPRPLYSSPPPRAAPGVASPVSRPPTRSVYLQGVTRPQSESET